jgi:hypothetical protein
MSCHAEAKIDLPLAPEAAWDAVMDWDGQSRWMLFTRVWATEQDGRGVGGGVSARTAVGALGFTDHMVITKWAPPLECRVKHLGTVVRGEGAFVVTPVPGGSTITWSEDVVPPLGRLGAAGWPVVRPGFELMMRTSLRRLAKQVNAR